MPVLFSGRIARASMAAATVALVSLPLANCASSPQVDAGVKRGAVGGVVAGFLVGALRGQTLKGAAIGAAVEDGQGYYDGWREENEDGRTRELASAIRESSQQQAADPRTPAADQAVAAREELIRFLGMWRLEGFALEEDGTRLDITATVRGRVEMGFFAQVDFMDLQLSGVNEQVWGSSTFGFDPAEGYTIVTRFNTLPTPFRMWGVFDAASTSFSFQELQYAGGTELQEGMARVLIQFQGPDRYTMETRVDGQQVEFYTVIRS